MKGRLMYGTEEEFLVQEGLMAISAHNLTEMLMHQIGELV